MVGGGNIGDALNNGFDQAWKQGLSGAAIGGVVGGFQAKGQGKDFWTGATKDKVVVQIKPDGSVVDKSATEHIVTDSNNPNHVDQTYYKNHRTVLTDNPNIKSTAYPDGTYEFTTELPKRLTITGRSVTEGNIPFITQDGRNLTMTFMDKPKDILLIGTRFHNRPINNIGELFNLGNIHPSWQSRMSLPFNQWWK